jgi:surface antigen
MVRLLLLASILLWLAPAYSAGAGAVEEFRDPGNRLLGRVITRSDDLLEARTASNRLLGTYSRSRNETRRANGTLLGRGNLLGAMIYEDARSSGLIGTNQSAPNIHQQRQQDRMDRLQAEENRAVVRPEVAARWARTTAAATTEDRRLAIEAFQRAGEALGREQFWQNPTSGNSGSVILFADQKTNDTFLHGKLVPCHYGRMVLHAAGETDIQRQLICKLPHNGVWTVVQVETD